MTPFCWVWSPARPLQSVSQEIRKHLSMCRLQGSILAGKVPVMPVVLCLLPLMGSTVLQEYRHEKRVS